MALFTVADARAFDKGGSKPLSQASEYTDATITAAEVSIRADFERIAGDVLVCLAPGSMPMDPRVLPWRNLAEGVRLGPNGPPFSRSRERRAGESL